MIMSDKNDASRFGRSIVSRIRYDGQKYNCHSNYQRMYSKRIIDRIEYAKHRRVLDVGCGNGIVTLDLWQKNHSMRIRGIDISASQISMARTNLKKLCKHDAYALSKRNNINFEICDICKIKEVNLYDLVFSNFALHWLYNPSLGYQRIYDSLMVGGELVVQQGCKGGLAGLHSKVWEAIKRLGFLHMYDGWEYPRWSPDKDDLYRLLDTLGFKNIEVTLITDTLPKSSELLESFIVASMIYYRLPCMNDLEYNQIVDEFRCICSGGNYDSTDCNLIANAVKQ